ncbi:MAG TPA: hypothetical protein VGY56_04085 [Verrucomicrobiae bacterium]|nr:hypothetical protein [Verrucomicrobiae bacterium]
MNRIKETLKSIGSFILGIVLMAALFFLIAAFLYGSAWLSTKVLPVLDRTMACSFYVLLLVGLPLSFFRNCRGWCSMAFLYWSYFCGLSLWMASLLVTMQLWGVTAAIIGLIFGGVGILPVALLACMFKGEWSLFFQLLLQLALLVAYRAFGIYLMHKTVAEIEAASGGDRPKQSSRPWLRWILVLPAAIAGWIGVQVILIMVSAIVDITWTGGLGGLNDDRTVQFLNSIASAWAFVFAGAKTSPSSRGKTALCLTASYVFAASVVIFLAKQIESEKGFWGTDWYLICLGASAITMALTSSGICKEEKQRREIEVEGCVSVLQDIEKEVEP